MGPGTILHMIVLASLVLISVVADGNLPAGWPYVSNAGAETQVVRSARAKVTREETPFQADNVIPPPYAATRSRKNPIEETPFHADIVIPPPYGPSGNGKDPSVEAPFHADIVIPPPYAPSQSRKDPSEGTPFQADDVIPPPYAPSGSRIDPSEETPFHADIVIPPPYAPSQSQKDPSEGTPFRADDVIPPPYAPMRRGSHSKGDFHVNESVKWRQNSRHVGHNQPLEDLAHGIHAEYNPALEGPPAPNDLIGHSVHVPSFVEFDVEMDEVVKLDMWKLSTIAFHGPGTMEGVRGLLQEQVGGNVTQSVKALLECRDDNSCKDVWTTDLSFAGAEVVITSVMASYDMLIGGNRCHITFDKQHAWCHKSDDKMSSEGRAYMAWGVPKLRPQQAPKPLAYVCHTGMKAKVHCHSLSAQGFMIAPPKQNGLVFV